MDADPRDVGTFGPTPMSPELALVDGELAALARSRLPEPQDTLARLSALPRPPTRPVLPKRAATSPRPPRRLQSRVLIGVAVVLVATVLLADVRVEVGRTGASAESASTVPGVTQRASPVRVRTPKGDARPAGSPLPRRLAWAPAPGADGYRVELFRGASRVFADTTKRPEVTLPAIWELDGRPQTLESGTYRWYVWSVVSGRISSGAIVQAKLVIPSS